MAKKQRFRQGIVQRSLKKKVLQPKGQSIKGRRLSNVLELQIEAARKRDRRKR